MVLLSFFFFPPSCMRVLYKRNFKTKWLDQPIHQLVFSRKPSFLSYSTSVLNLTLFCIFSVLRYKEWKAKPMSGRWKPKKARENECSFLWNKAERGCAHGKHCWRAYATKSDDRFLRNMTLKTTNGSLNWKSTAPIQTQTFQATNTSLKLLSTDQHSCFCISQSSWTSRLQIRRQWRGVAAPATGKVVVNKTWQNDHQLAPVPLFPLPEL